MANQGNPFSNSSEEGHSEEQGSAFAAKSQTGDTENQGNPFSENPQIGSSDTEGSQEGTQEQGDAFAEGSATGRSDQQGIPFNEGLPGATGATGAAGERGFGLEETSGVSLGQTVLVKSETNTGEFVYFTVQTVAYPQFTISVTGEPSDSSVYTNQEDFTITVDNTSGSITTVDSINTNEETGTVEVSSATFTGSGYELAGSYTFTAKATGLSGEPVPVSSQKTVTGSWTRFVPAYWVVTNTQPAALPTASTGVVFGTQSVSGSQNTSIYLITTQNDFRFNVGPYEVFENLAGTITGQVDEGGISRSFNVFKMGAIGGSGSATYTLG